jgi:hypothetical protein
MKLAGQCCSAENLLDIDGLLGAVHPIRKRFDQSL